MNDSLRGFLSAAYKERVLGIQGGSADILAKNKDDLEFMAAVKAELARLKKLDGHLDLSKRDFPSYQSMRALQAALGE